MARGLRAHGIDVTTTKESGLRTAGDEEQLAFAIRESRGRVTHDDDFLKRPPDLNHPGIAYSRLGALSLGELIRWLHLMHGTMRPDELRNRIERGFRF